MFRCPICAHRTRSGRHLLSIWPTATHVFDCQTSANTSERCECTCRSPAIFSSSAAEALRNGQLTHSCHVVACADVRRRGRSFTGVGIFSAASRKDAGTDEMSALGWMEEESLQGRTRGKWSGREWCVLLPLFLHLFAFKLAENMCSFSLYVVLSVRRYAATAMMSRRPDPAQESALYMDDEVDGSSKSSASGSHSSQSSSLESSSSASSSASSAFASPVSSATAADSEVELLSYMRKRPQADPESLRGYLRELLPPLEFPDTVAKQMLTHISAKEAWAGHNGRLAFIGPSTSFLG